jgi:hypothetical protein
MGVVYKAHDPKLNRVVAVKLLRPRSDASATDHLSLRMLREARAMARLRHPNVVAVYDVGDVGDQVFVAMEYVLGGTLSSWLAEKPRSWREILAMYVSAGRGLAAAHDAGLVHRDFKPDNVLVGRDGEVRVTDFGLARSAEGKRTSLHDSPAIPSEPELGSDLTNTGVLVGTPAYMSPEQMRREPATFRSDIFSFCASLYEALHGVRPFEGATLGVLRSNVASGRMRKAPRQSRVPAMVRRALVRGLHPQPEERFPSMHLLIDALERAARPRWRAVVAVTGAALTALGLTLAIFRTGPAHSVPAPYVAGSLLRRDATVEEGRAGRTADAPMPHIAEGATATDIDAAIQSPPIVIGSATPVKPIFPPSRVQAPAATSSGASPALSPGPLQVDTNDDDLYVLPDERR